eukprot:ANDGO_02979.mRNA.1 hypothetical protein
MSGIGFACLPAAVTLAFIPHFIKVYYVAKLTKIDIRNTRESTERALAKDSPLTRIIKRSLACHNNHLEGLPIFIGAFLAAFVSGVPKSSINSAALTYVFARVLFTYFYVTGDQVWKGFARFLSFSAGLFSCFYLFTLATIRMW